MQRFQRLLVVGRCAPVALPRTQCALFSNLWKIPEDHAPPKHNRLLVLHDLQNIDGAKKTKKRVGRGRGSGIGIHAL